MKTEQVTYSCDKCGKKLKTSNNTLDIKTSLSEDGYWARLHVRIIHIHGMHNDGTTEEAELCKSCASGLLEDALKRVRKGERASAGTEEVEQCGWK